VEIIATGSKSEPVKTAGVYRLGHIAFVLAGLAGPLAQFY
jgi:hypothetical protein